MNRNSYLNPEGIRGQCMQAVKLLINDNYRIEGIHKCLIQFMNDAGLQGEAYSALKTQIGDYLLILDAKVAANQKDIADFNKLYGSVGEEVLDGNTIFDMMEQALAEKAEYETSAQNCEKAARNASWFGEELYNSAKASYYRSLADNAQNRYEKWRAKKDTYDKIEANTRALFSESASYRDKVDNALSEITKVFDGGQYHINENAAWRIALLPVPKRKEWNEEVEEAMIAYGYTPEEMEVLIEHGVNMTLEDIEKLKQTQNTKSVFVSKDCKALFYNGKIYYINEPNTRNVEIGPVLTWNMDYSVEKTKTEFDLLAGITGISGEDIPENKVYTSDNSYLLYDSSSAYGSDVMKMAGGLHAFLLVESFVLSGISHSEVTMNFESSGSNRRVTILVGNSADRQKFQNINYALPVNTYGNQPGYTEKQQASAQAAAIYTMCTGIDAAKDNQYTLVGTLDERHKDCVYSGYLSYSEEGRLQYTPIVFPNDVASVATCSFSTGKTEQVLYDLTDKLSEPIAVDATTQMLFEKLIENN